MNIVSDIDFDKLLSQPKAEAVQPAKARAQPKTAKAVTAAAKVINKAPKATAAKAQPAEDAFQAPSERARLMLMVGRYHTGKRFKELLKKSGVLATQAKLKKMDNNQLKQYIHNMNLVIDNQSNEQTFSNVCLYGLGALERGTRAIGFQTQGASKLLENDDDFLDALEQVRLENSDLITISPTTKLALITARTFARAHLINSSVAAKARVVEPEPKVVDEVDPDIHYPEPSKKGD